MTEDRNCRNCKFQNYFVHSEPCNTCVCTANKPNFQPKEGVEMDSLKEFAKSVDKAFGLEETYDVVNNPQHYCEGAHECIDVMENLFGTNAVIDFCKCNIFKYRFRAAKKNGEEDISKAEWYETKLMELIAKRNTDDWIDIF